MCAGERGEEGEGCGFRGEGGGKGELHPSLSIPDRLMSSLSAFIRSSDRATAFLQYTHNKMCEEQEQTAS